MEIEEVESDDVRSERQQRILNVRKVKSRDAARNRRSKENTQYLELAKLLPFPSSVTSQLDKASIIRLTISFLKYQELIAKAFRRRIDQGLLPPNKHGQGHVNGKGGSGAFAQLFGEDLGVHLLQALDGFLFCVSQDGKFIYISETVTTHLGLSQLDLIGTNVFNIIHPDDQKGFSELLNRNVPNNYHALPFHAFDDFDAMTSNEMQYNLKTNQESISTFTRMKCALIKRAGCYVKSSGYKVIHISGKLVPYRNMDRNGYRSHALVATGQPLPPPTICELKLDTKVFVSRVSMDLKIVFCEGRIRKYMNFKARDIVGLSAYEFYHSNDMQIVHKGHHDCLQSGKCVTAAYRWIDKNGGYVWMQTVGTVIKRHGPYGEESQILCVNYISSDVESGNAVTHNLQQQFKQLELNDNDLADPYDDYGLDNRHVETITSNDLTSMYTQKGGENVMDKEDFIKAVRYDTDTVWYNNMDDMRLPPPHPAPAPYPVVPQPQQQPPPPVVPQPTQVPQVLQVPHVPQVPVTQEDALDDLIKPYDERIPSLQETLEQEEADRLMAEIMTESYGVEFISQDNTGGSESGYSDMSPGQQQHLSGSGSPPEIAYPLNNIVPQTASYNKHTNPPPAKSMFTQRAFPTTGSNNVQPSGPRHMASNMSNAMVGYHNNNNNYYQNYQDQQHSPNYNPPHMNTIQNNMNPVAVRNINSNNMDTIVKSELPSPPARQVMSWTGGHNNNRGMGKSMNDSVVYLLHPTQYNNIVENSVAMDLSDTNYPENNNYRGGNQSQYSPGTNSHYSPNAANSSQYSPGVNTQYSPGANSQYSPGSNSQYSPGATTQYNSNANVETISLLKQLENNQNGYLNDISVEQSMYGCHIPSVVHRDYP